MTAFKLLVRLRQVCAKSCLFNGSLTVRSRVRACRTQLPLVDLAKTEKDGSFE